MATSRAFRLVSLALLVTLSASSTGCYKNVAIRPDQIPLLSNMPAPLVIGQTGNATVYAVAATTVLTPEGTNVQIAGEYDLALRLASGREYSFQYPVRSDRERSGVLTITGANRPATRLSLPQIRTASVSQFDGPMTVLAIFLVPVLIVGGVLGLYALTVQLGD